MTVEVVVTGSAGPLRRAVGPTGWVVLEHLTAEGAPGEAGRVVVYTTIRRLAEELGLGRDAVASAVQALAVAGYVAVKPSRSETGRFGSCRYVVASTAALRRLDGSVGPAAAAPPAVGRPIEVAGQLSFADQLDNNNDNSMTTTSITNPNSIRPRTRTR